MAHPKREGPPLTTLAVKVEPALALRVQQFSLRHRRSISELIRDGLEWRLRQGADLGAVELGHPDQPPLVPPVLDVATVQAMIDAALAAVQPTQQRHIVEVPASALKHCRAGHPPYPGDRTECPECVRGRQRKHRQGQRAQATQTTG